LPQPDGAPEGQQLGRSVAPRQNETLGSSDGTAVLMPPVVSYLPAQNADDGVPALQSSAHHCQRKNGV